MKDSYVFEKIFSSQYDRGNTTLYNECLNYFCSYIGVEEEGLYNLEIFKLKCNFENREDTALFTENIPNPSDFDTINYFKSKLGSCEKGIKDLDISIVKNHSLNDKIKEGLDIVLKQEEKEFSNERVKLNFIIKIMSWISTYIDPLKIDKNDTPKVIFYGDIKKHEIYLLLSLYLAGFDILYLNPNSKSIIEKIDIEKYKIELIENDTAEDIITFEERVVLGEKIDKASVKKAFTVGAEASKRISEELLNDAGFIKPWQLQDRKLKSILLSSTIDEVSIYWKQPLKLRPGFKFDNNIVETPVFLSKINGVYSDSREYFDFIRLLRDVENAFFIEYDGDFRKISKEFTKDAFSLSFAINSNGIIDKKLILDEKIYPISTLSESQQTMILEKIEEVIAGDMFVGGLNREDVIRGLYTVLNMDKRLVHLINSFDYSLINPKLIIYMNESLVIEKELSFLILLLSKVGFDIVILSPAGANCIENVINTQLLDVHRLDKMVYDFKLLPIEEDTSIFKKIFGKRSGFKWG